MPNLPSMLALVNAPPFDTYNPLILRTSLPSNATLCYAYGGCDDRCTQLSYQGQSVSTKINATDCFWLAEPKSFE